MTEYMVLIVGDANRWWTTMSLKKIIAAVGDGIEVRRTVDPAERPS